MALLDPDRRIAVADIDCIGCMEDIVVAAGNEVGLGLGDHPPWEEDENRSIVVASSAIA